VAAGFFLLANGRIGVYESMLGIAHLPNPEGNRTIVKRFNQVIRIAARYGLARRRNLYSIPPRRDLHIRRIWKWPEAEARSGDICSNTKQIEVFSTSGMNIYNLLAYGICD
jgi:hypothetical protein